MEKNIAETMAERITAWNTATELVLPIVALHGVKPYNLGQVFKQDARYTEVDQHINSVISVADWLLEK